MKYYIKTFGCQQNKADSERIASSFEARGMTKAASYTDANYVVINTCMVRRMAEDRVYGLVKNLSYIKEKKIKNNNVFKIVVTGCMVGLAYRDKSGEYLQRIRSLMPEVDEFMPIEEVGFDSQPVRQDNLNAWIPISNGCNNFCTFCVVPFTRGHEISRPYGAIIAEAKHLKQKGYKTITLLGQNVNSYGADLIKQTAGGAGGVTHQQRAGNEHWCGGEPRQNLPSIKPIYVKHLGRYRIPTLFPYLLEEVAKIGFEKVDFISSNPWDFSDELIDVIARNINITRTIHLPLQSGDDNMLKRMNRWYTAEEYLRLISNLKSQISNLKITTDIIVGFCGETDEEFKNTVGLCRAVGFEKAYVAMYSPRPMTAATKVMKDDIPHAIKKRRWQILEDLINFRYQKRRPKAGGRRYQPAGNTVPLLLTPD